MTDWSSFAKPPVLVTGVHRTGTTWVGKMLAAGRGIGYISEPLNVWHRPGVLRAATPYWYTYISQENEADFLPALQETLGFRYHPWAELRSLHGRKDILRMGRDWGIFSRGWLLRQRPLLKDPFAIFSIPWFIDRLGCRVVVTVRHPAAFASSLLRLGWVFNFGHLLAQPLLMRDHLAAYRSEMEQRLVQPDDIIGQSGLLWRIIYRWIWQLREKAPDIIVVRHEDLSDDPAGGFRSLYQTLDIAFTGRAEQRIAAASSAENPSERSGESIYTVRLDSRANLQNWKRRLTGEQINRIRAMTEEVAARYYPDSSWE